MWGTPFLELSGFAGYLLESNDHDTSVPGCIERTVACCINQSKCRVYSGPILSGDTASEAVFFDYDKKYADLPR
jgi:hypothetical protein